MTPSDTGNALVLEDNPETLAWLAACVQTAFPDLTVYKAADLAAARGLVARHEFTLALIDLGLPDGSGIDAIKLLNSTESACYVVVATIYDDDHHLFSALRAGARGYVLKDQDRERIVGYLKGIRKQQPAISAEASRRMVAHFNSKGEHLRQVQLTARETEVLCLIGKGYKVEDAAAILTLSPDTVKGYVKSIYAKLEVSNRSEATLEAIRLGLIDPD